MPHCVSNMCKSSMKPMGFWGVFFFGERGWDCQLSFKSVTINILAGGLQYLSGGEYKYMIMYIHIYIYIFIYLFIHLFIYQYQGCDPSPVGNEFSSMKWDFISRTRNSCLGAWFGLLILGDNVSLPSSSQTLQKKGNEKKNFPNLFIIVRWS